MTSQFTLPRSKGEHPRVPVDESVTSRSSDSQRNQAWRRIVERSIVMSRFFLAYRRRDESEGRAGILSPTDPFRLSNRRTPTQRMNFSLSDLEHRAKPPEPWLVQQISM